MDYPVFPYTPREAKRAGIEFDSELNRKCKFARRLAQLRAEHHMSQQKLADALEVSKSTISLYETGDTVPDAKMIVRMCKIFDVSCDYFLCQSDYRSSEQSHRTLEDMGLDETATRQIDDLDVFTLAGRSSRIDLPFTPKAAFNQICADPRFPQMMQLLGDCYQMQIGAARTSDEASLDYTNLEVIGCRHILALVGEASVPMGEIAEVYLQRACEVLKEIVRDLPTEDPETGEEYQIEVRGNAFSPLSRGRRTPPAQSDSSAGNESEDADDDLEDVAFDILL